MLACAHLHFVGYRSRNEASYPVEGTQCPRAVVNSVLEIMKFITTNTLTTPAYLEMFNKPLSMFMRASYLTLIDRDTAQ
jgi:hypothetical protein